MINLSKKFIEPGKTIGIIGGGQLGQMMALSAKAAGFRVIVLEPGQDSPAGQVADEQIIAAYNDHDALTILANKSDVITYEFENIDYEALSRLSQKAYIPQGAELIRITQDRIIEKQSLRNAGVNVAPYSVIHNEDELLKAVKKIGLPSVLKTSRGGYDGKGQSVIRKNSDIQAAAMLLESGPCVLESWIPFEKELSVVITRNIHGELKCFPIGENIHINNILHETIAPARVAQQIEKQVLEIAEKIAEHLQLVGTLAIELFLVGNEELYVNELAPRPHNSGHYTIESCNLSQFDQHIRAICSWPLQEVELLKPAIMINILGQHVEGVINEIPNQSDWFVHFYGKKEAKHNRKMGHITILTEHFHATLQTLEKTEIWQ